MSNRFLQKSFLRCTRCGNAQRKATGYRPIANPMLFDSNKQCSDFANERRVNTNFTGLKLSEKCTTCDVIHSQWTPIDFQEFLDGSTKVKPQRGMRIAATVESPRP